MLSKEIKQLIELSGGKIIISEGDVTDSYVVMKLNKHLEELARTELSDLKKTEKVFEKDDEKVKKSLNSGLTRNELLDRINIDIAEMKRRHVEKEIIDSFELKNKKKEDEESEFYYEKVH